MNERVNVQREKWLTIVIEELEPNIRSKRLMSADAIRRMILEYQDELKTLEEKGKESPLNPL